MKSLLGPICNKSHGASCNTIKLIAFFLHGGYGTGSFIIPLIANPFLAIPAPKHKKRYRKYNTARIYCRQHDRGNGDFNKGLRRYQVFERVEN